MERIIIQYAISVSRTASARPMRFSSARMRTRAHILATGEMWIVARRRSLRRFTRSGRDSEFRRMDRQSLSGRRRLCSCRQR